MTDQNPTQPLATSPAGSERSASTAPPPAPASAWAPPTGPAGAPTGPTGFDGRIAPIGGAPRGRSPLRWIVALVVVALVVAGGLGATLLLTASTSGTSTVVGYVPADTVTYLEARLDLPGGQRAEVAKTLAAFPGFADQSSLDAKLGELYDRIIKAATNGTHDYQTEIAPWFGGQLAIAQGPQDVRGLAMPGASPATAPNPTDDPTAGLPACTGGATVTPAPSLGLRYLLLADVKDVTKAEAWVGSVLAGSNVQTSDRTCDGVDVHTVQPSAADAGALPEMGWAILGGKVLAVGDLSSIRLAIATNGAGGLSTTPNFQKAVGAVQGDHVGFLYEDLKAVLSSQLNVSSQLDTSGTLGAVYSVLAGTMPDWVAADLKASDGNVVVDAVEPLADVQPTTNRASDLAAMAPSNTIALMDVHDLGKTLGAIKGKLSAEPKLQEYVQQLDTALGLAGGFGGTIGWIGDAGLAVTRDGSSVSGGVLIRPDDAGAAGRLFTQVRSLLDLTGAASANAFADEQYKGVTITSVDLSSLAPLAQSGLGADLGGASVPSNLKLVYAATDKVVVLTLDPAFAKAVIDTTQGGDSLAKNPRFSTLVSTAGSTGTGLYWLDVTATRELVEGSMSPDQKTKYESDVKPYLLPIDALVVNSVADNGLSRGTMILSISH